MVTDPGGGTKVRSSAGTPQRTRGRMPPRSCGRASTCRRFAPVVLTPDRPIAGERIDLDSPWSGTPSAKLLDRRPATGGFRQGPLCVVSPGGPSSLLADLADLIQAEDRPCFATDGPSLGQEMDAAAERDCWNRLRGRFCRPQVVIVQRFEADRRQEPSGGLSPALRCGRGGRLVPRVGQPSPRRPLGA